MIATPEHAGRPGRTLPAVLSRGGAGTDLEAYMADCRHLVTEEICRLFDHRQEDDDGLYRLILDYPLREGKALRPTLAIAMCRALGGDVEAVLPTTATLELTTTPSSSTTTSKTTR